MPLRVSCRRDTVYKVATPPTSKGATGLLCYYHVALLFGIRISYVMARARGKDCHTARATEYSGIVAVAMAISTNNFTQYGRDSGKYNGTW